MFRKKYRKGAQVCFTVDGTNPANQLMWYSKYPIIYTVFLHPKWLPDFFHQQYHDICFGVSMLLTWIQHGAGGPINFQHTYYIFSACRVDPKKVGCKNHHPEKVLK